VEVPKEMIERPVWVYLDGWAGNTRVEGTLLKVNPKLSRVRIERDCYRYRAGQLVNTPNKAITFRELVNGNT
jgi:hypothetical protein